uniref:Ig-like domain-containing protein n=1 Tax=Poecilia mexicana TaxID=48701 RepID=A0A3B3YTF2_9TELE
LRCFFRKMDVTANIGAETGQDVILPCQTPDNNPVIVVEWRRNDSVSEYVLLFRDDQLDPDNQQPTFRNRVDLLFRPIKDRNASLVLKNVTTDDKGTYECRVIERDPKRGQRAGLTSEPVSIVNLDVVPPGESVSWFVFL